MRTAEKIILILTLIVILGLSNCKSEKKGYRILKNPVVVKDRNGIKRNYRLFMPDSERSVPLLVYFHGVMSEKFKSMPVLKGYTGSPVEETGLISFCRINGIALLVPEPSYTFKFLNVKARGWSPFEKEIDGIEKMIDRVSESFNISGDIYLAGISAGAVLIHHLANRRPERYRAILSHSQAYISENNRLLKPVYPGPKFGVLFCYTKGDYKNLKEFCEKSYELYKSSGYNTMLLKDLPPKSHKWAKSYNRRFWRLLRKIALN